MRAVESSVSDIWRIAGTTARSANLPVRVAVTEGLGTFWLAPRIVQYIDADSAPARLEVQCKMESVDVLRLEADISVRLVEPTSPDLVRKKLGTLYLIPFASPECIERHGMPQGIADLVAAGQR